MTVPPKTADDVRRELGWLYTPDEIEVWLTSPNKLLNGRRAIDMIEAGEIDEVLRLVAQLNDGAYL